MKKSKQHLLIILTTQYLFLQRHQQDYYFLDVAVVARAASFVPQQRYHHDHAAARRFKLSSLYHQGIKLSSNNNVPCFFRKQHQQQSHYHYQKPLGFKSDKDEYFEKSSSGLLNKRLPSSNHSSAISNPKDESMPMKSSSSSSSSRSFPMDYIVNHSMIKEALILNAINPKINGVVIWGKRGTGKSVLARSAQCLLPPTIRRIKGNRYNIDATGSDEKFHSRLLDDDTILLPKDDDDNSPKTEIETETIPLPFVNIPLNVMYDSLIGTVDLERSLQLGRTIFSPGLLATAHRGILYVDDINLLDDEAVNLLLNTVVTTDGMVRVEREGLSVTYPCRPEMFLATYNPEEGELRECLLDRIGISLSTDVTNLTIGERCDVVENVLGFHPGMTIQVDDAAQLRLTNAEKRERELRSTIATARDNLKNVTLTSKQILYLCQEATRADCEGQRGEIVASEIARASAALGGRVVPNVEDLRKAVLLAILPRAKHIPEYESFEESNMETDTSDPEAPPPPYTQDDDQVQPQDDHHEEEKNDDDTEENTQDDDDTTNDDEPDDNTKEEDDDNILEIPQEFIFDPLSLSIDPQLLTFTKKWTKKGTTGKASKILNLLRGRYVKPLIPKGGSANIKKGHIAIGATLRAAAPHQKFRRQHHHPNTNKLIHISKDDIRLKRLSRKSSTLILFLVDASGSMALNRMNAAKGAALSLLSSAYRHRDKIGLVTFRDARAELVVPPTRSVAAARRRLEVLPCGGASPLSHALLLGMMVGLKEKRVRKDVGSVVVVCITDGRANVPSCVSFGEGFDAAAQGVGEVSKDGMPSKRYLKEEVMECARRLGELEGFNLLVIDTEDQFVGTGLGMELARVGQGNYCRLDVGTGGDVVERVTKENLEMMRHGS